MYKIELTKDAAKYYVKSNKKTKKLLNQCFDGLKENPYEGSNIKKLHGELEGMYRYRIGSLRAVYSIEESRIVVIIVAIGSRGDIYKKV